MNKYTKHTPGPWIFTDLGQVVDRQDRTIVPNVHAHNIPNPAYPKGNLHYLAEDDGGEANGRLIAAAPNLLKTCRVLLERAQQLSAGTEAIDGLIPDARMDLELDIEDASKLIDRIEGGAE
jgi:hypothetical protein